MSYGLIGYAQVGDAAQPSPSIWGDCPNTLLNDKGLGYFFAQDFLGNYANTATVTAAGIESDADTGSTFPNADSATYGPNVVKMAVTNTDNDASAIFGNELGKIVRNSGNKFWFEARFAPGALGDSAFFIGLTTLANATRDVVADDPSNNGAAGLTAATVVGFVSVQASSAIKTVNAVYSKGTGTPVTVLADVGNATAFTGSQSNNAQFPGGTPAGYTAPGNLAANTFVKYGIRFDGYHTLEFYVNGVKVASQNVDSTIDQASYLVPVINAKTGAATAINSYVDFVRAGYQARS